MSFSDELAQWPRERVESLIGAAQPADVRRAIARNERGPAELAALLSPAAVPRLELIAREAQRLTRWQFGRTISLHVLWVCDLFW